MNMKLCSMTVTMPDFLRKSSCKNFPRVKTPSGTAKYAKDQLKKKKKKKNPSRNRCRPCPTSKHASVCKITQVTGTQSTTVNQLTTGISVPLMSARFVYSQQNNRG